MGGLENNVSRFPDWTAISVSRPADRDRSVTGRIDTFFQFGTREICPGVYLFHLSSIDAVSNYFLSLHFTGLPLRFFSSPDILSLSICPSNFLLTWICFFGGEEDSIV